jgi:hypothetical protein
MKTSWYTGTCIPYSILFRWREALGYSTCEAPPHSPPTIRGLRKR